MAFLEDSSGNGDLRRLGRSPNPRENYKHLLRPTLSRMGPTTTTLFIIDLLFILVLTAGIYDSTIGPKSSWRLLAVLGALTAALLGSAILLFIMYLNSDAAAFATTASLAFDPMLAAAVVSGVVLAVKLVSELSRRSAPFWAKALCAIVLPAYGFAAGIFFCRRSTFFAGQGAQITSTSSALIGGMDGQRSSLPGT